MPMGSDQGTLRELRSSLAASGGQAFVRVVADTELRTVWYVDVVAGASEDHPGWQPHAWCYLDATFIAAQVPSALLAAVLGSADAGTLALEDFKFPSRLSMSRGGWSTGQAGPGMTWFCSRGRSGPGHTVLCARLGTGTCPDWVGPPGPGPTEQTTTKGVLTKQVLA